MFRRLLQLQKHRRYYGAFNKFMETVKKEVKKNEEMQSSLKELEVKVADFKESKILKNTRTAIEKTSKEIYELNKEAYKTIKQKSEEYKVGENIKKTIDVAAEGIKKITPSENNPAVKTIKKIVDNPVVNTISDNVGKAAESLVDESSALAYGGYYNKDQRNRIKLERIKKYQAAKEKERLEQELYKKEGGPTALVVHKTANSGWQNKLRDLQENNVVLRKFKQLQETYEDSNNIFIFYTRNFMNSIYGTIAGVFEETETARVLAEFMKRDPNFEMEAFLKEAREYIIPEIVEAYSNLHMPSLNQWCTQSAFTVIKAKLDSTKKGKVFIESKILDLRNLQIHESKFDADRPIIILTFDLQHVTFSKNEKGEVVEGSPDKINRSQYVIALTKEETVTDPITNGWKLVDIHMRAL